jgi:hypothetical protein
MGTISFVKAAKTDTITLYNGDKVTCEIKQLSLGKLQVKTSDMGTLSIKWFKIAFIESKQVLEIVMHNRTKIFGLLSKADSAGYVVISTGLMVKEVYQIIEIVSISQVATSFWKGLEGSVNYGLSYTKGTNNLQSNFAANAKLRGTHFLNQIQLNSIISDNATTRSRKQDATYSLNYYFRKRSFLRYSVAIQQNTELGIDSRLINSFSYGLTAAQSKSNLLKFAVGSSLNIETDNENNKNQNLEALFSATYDLFLLASPKVSFTFAALAYPSLTTWGRFRSDLSTKLSWEIFNDFTFGFSVYFNSDNQPSSTTASKTDWGTTTSIGYTF